MASLAACKFRAVFPGSDVHMMCTLEAHEGKHHLVKVATCSVPDCTRKSSWSGMCTTHHRRAQAAGSPPPSRHPARLPIPEEWVAPIAAFAASLKLRDLSPQTIAMREYHLRRVARQVSAHPFDVTLDDLTTWMGSQEWKNETARAVRSSLRTFYQWAVKTGRVKESPAEELPQIRPGGRNPHPVPEDDFHTAIAEADPRARMMVRLAGDLGMRRAEVSQLHRDDLVETDEGYLLTILGKGRKVRHIPMPETLAADLLAYIDSVGGGYAFPAPGGGHLSPHWVGTIVTKLLPAGYTMHKLRHRAATQAHRKSGGDLLLTSNLLGHSSVATTQIYVAPDYSRLRSIVEGIAS